MWWEKMWNKIKENKGTLALLWALKLLVILAISCNKNEKVKEIAGSKGPFCLTPSLKERIRIEPVSNSPEIEFRRLTGEVEYNPDKVVQYTSLVSGVITKVFVSLGDKVQKGALIAEIKSPELSALESDRQSIESRLTVSERNVKAAQSMYNDGISSEKALMEAKSDEKVLRSDLDKIKLSLSFFTKSGETDIYQIRAPESGYIVNKSITPGVQVTPQSEPLFTISDLSNVWVTVNVYAGDLMFVKEKMPVKLQCSAYPNETFEGNIKALSQVFDEDAKVLKARVVMQNTDLKLKPGMFVDVLVKKETGRQAVSVPQKAVIFNNNANYVIVYDTDCNLEARQVELSPYSNSDTGYIDKGLKEGEKIITQNQLLIYEALQK